MLTKNSVKKIIVWMPVLGFLLGPAPGQALDTPLVLAQGVQRVREMREVAPPREIREVAPPREIRKVAPPREIREVAPPREIRKVAPPREIRKVAPPREIRRLQPATEIHQRSPYQAGGRVRPTQVERRRLLTPSRTGRVARDIPKPELTVRGLGLSSTRPEVGEKVFASARIYNSGDQGAGKVKVRFFLGDRQVGEERLISLPPGASRTVSTYFATEHTGQQRLRVQVEPLGGTTQGLSSGRTLTVVETQKRSRRLAASAPVSRAVSDSGPKGKRQKSEKPGAQASAFPIPLPHPRPETKTQLATKPGDQASAIPINIPYPRPEGGQAGVAKPGDQASAIPINIPYPRPEGEKPGAEKPGDQVSAFPIPLPHPRPEAKAQSAAEPGAGTKVQDDSRGLTVVKSAGQAKLTPENDRVRAEAALAAKQATADMAAKTGRPLTKPLAKAEMNLPRKPQPGAEGGKMDFGQDMAPGGIPNPQAKLKEQMEKSLHGKGQYFGDGLEGVHDQGARPKKSLGDNIPQIPLSKQPGFPAGKGGVDGGLYGGINQKYLPGGVSDDLWDFTTKSAGRISDLGGQINMLTSLSKGNKTLKSTIFWTDSDGTDKETTITRTKGRVQTPFKSKDGKFTSKTTNSTSPQPQWKPSESERGMKTETHISKDGKVKMTVTSGPLSPRPDGEGGDHLSPKQGLTDPKLVKQALQVQKKSRLRPDSGVSDPMPVKTRGQGAGARGAGMVSSVAATQAGADIKWKFIGKKPGSGVTDPAETKEGRGDLGGVRVKHFEVIDPPEAASVQAALAKAQTSAAKDTAGKSATVAAVTGSLQKLTEQGGKKGWAPLKPGDHLGQGSIIRVNNNSGGEVGFGSLPASARQSLSLVHASSTHTIFQVNVTGKSQKTSGGPSSSARMGVEPLPDPGNKSSTIKGSQQKLGVAVKANSKLTPEND